MARQSESPGSNCVNSTQNTDRISKCGDEGALAIPSTALPNRGLVPRSLPAHCRHLKAIPQHGIHFMAMEDDPADGEYIRGRLA